MGEGLPIEKLRAFLRELSPEARSVLMTGLEQATLRGEDVPGADFILHELRDCIRAARRQPDRVGTPARTFFKLFEPFLVDDTTQRHIGRLPRAALEPIWEWISRDLLPAETASYSEAVTDALLVKDNATADNLARSFQDAVRDAASSAFVAVQKDDKAMRRLAMQVGTAQPLDDLKDFVGILRARGPLANLSSRLPNFIRDLAGDHLEAVKVLLDSVAKSPDVLLYAVILVMGRLSSPWQLIRLATRAAESDKVARINETPYKVTVTIVLAELERMVGELRTDMRAGRIADATLVLKDIHDAARMLRSEMDMMDDSPWSRQLSALRAEVSDLLKAEIEGVPGRVRRQLRLRPSKEIAPGSALNEDDVIETAAAIDFVGTCRKLASELAINEVTMRAYSELHHYLESSVQTLIDALRTAGDADRRFRKSQADAAVRFCGKMLGEDYAATLAKAVEVAAHGAVAAQAERKAAKA